MRLSARDSRSLLAHSTRGTSAAAAARTVTPVWIESRNELVTSYQALAQFAFLIPETSFAAIPLEVEGRVLGVLSYSYEGARQFEELERSFVQLFAQHAAQALARAALFDKQVETRATLEAIIEASPAAISLLDQDGTVHLWNPLERIFGWTREVAVGHLLPIIDPQQVEAFKASIASVAAGSAMVQEERQRKTRDGRRITISIDAAPLRLPDGRVRVVSMSEDITRRKLAEERLRFLADAGGILSSSLDFERVLQGLLAIIVPAWADFCVLEVVEEPRAQFDVRPQPLPLATTKSC